MICSTCKNEFRTKYSLYKHRKECCSRELSSPTQPQNPTQEPTTTISFSPLQKKILNIIKNDTEIKALINTIVDEAIEKKMKIRPPRTTKKPTTAIAASTPQPPMENTTSSTSTNPLVDFLKVRCRNAMTYDKFMSEIEITETDLDTIAQKGFIDGITEVFKQKLDVIDIYERPFHCINLETYDMYFRFDKSRWKKDNENNENLIQIIYDFSQQIDLAIVAYREVLQDDARCDHWSRCARGGIERPKKIQDICKNIAKMVFVGGDLHED